MDAPAVVEFKRHEVIGVLAEAGDIGRARYGVDVDFEREVAGIGHDNAVTRRCAEAVQMRSQPGDRIDVYHVTRAQAPRKLAATPRRTRRSRRP